MITCTSYLASSPGHSHIFNVNIENMGVAWGRGYQLPASGMTILATGSFPTGSGESSSGCIIVMVCNLSISL